MKVKMKRCMRCENLFPATVEYFRRNSSLEDGLDGYCKTCASSILKAHFVHFTRKDVRVKGTQGVMCILWAERCDVCTDLAACWRIANLSPGSSKYPAKLNELNAE